VRNGFTFLNDKRGNKKPGYELPFKSFLLSSEILKYFYVLKKESDGMQRLMT